MDIVGLVRKIVLEVDKEVKRVRWTNEEIDKYFGRRSAIQVIDNGTTCYMNSCLDLTLVSSAIMHSREIPHTFVIEEYLPTKDFNFNRLHFALEFQENDKKYFLNYKKNKEVYILEGNYNGREDMPHIQMIKIPGEKINPYKPIYKSLGFETLNDLIKNKFMGYSWESNINRLKQDNYEENYKNYKKIYGGEFNIITPQSPLSI